MENGHSVQNGISIEEDFDLPEVQSSQKLSDLGKLRTTARPASRKRSGARKNPLKVLAARENIKVCNKYIILVSLQCGIYVVALQDSYEEERTNITKLEQQRLASRGYGANFTSAALAGLAAKADLTKTRLKSTKNTPMASSDDLRPFKDPMLLRVKGRKRVQTRLVEPVAASLCSDDAYLLVTEKKVFAWFGEFCNVIERAKVNVRIYVKALCILVIFIIFLCRKWLITYNVNMILDLSSKVTQRWRKTASQK